MSEKQANIQEETLTIDNVEILPPSKYVVILHNDDYTPMDFVVSVLQKYFGHSLDNATELMFQVHYQGRAICGVYSAEIAETKTNAVNEYARRHEHPLLATFEKVE